MIRVAVAFLVVAAGALVFEFAVFAGLKANSPWVKALPALVPFAGLVAGVFWASKKESWLTEAVRAAMRGLLRRPVILYLCSITLCIAAAAAGTHVWNLTLEREGKFTVQIVQRDDVPDQYVREMPVTIDHKLRTEVVQRLTNEAGRAVFDVDTTDVFAIRIHKAKDTAAAVFVLRSDAAVGEKTKRGFQLVRLADIPDDSWVSPATTSRAVNEEFAQMPPSYLRWRGDERPPHVINETGQPPAFPFALPDAETMIVRKEYTVGFSPVLRLPRWVAYRIVPGPSIRRRMDKFLPDPTIPERYQASSEDYRGNDYDRGHLVRRADLFGLGEEATLKIFYFSAVVPQLSYVNQRSWLALEEYTSAKAASGAAVYVIRGAIYDAAPGSSVVNVTLMGGNRVPVPTHFFQIAYVVVADRMSIESHIMPNAYVSVKNKDLQSFRTSVEAIAAKTGLTFAQSGS